MPRPKKERGRPMERHYPPRIEASAEEIAQVFMKTPPRGGREDVEIREYRCAACARTVNYPETLYKAGHCKDCRHR